MKIGFIGVGGRAVIFQEELRKLGGDIQVVGGADIYEPALAGFRERFPEAASYTDYCQLLTEQKMDALFLITPDYLHEEMALAAMEHVKNIYLEKPLAITIEGCDRILQKAMRNKIGLYLGHNLRFFPVVEMMKKIIDAGTIGQVQTCWCRHFINYGGDAYFKDWHSERKNTGGLLIQKGAHDIDAIHYLMGAYSVNVVGMGMLSVYDKCARRGPNDPQPVGWVQDNSLYPPENVRGFSPVIDVEDHNMIMMRLANGAQACYMQSHYAPDNERNYTFIGTRGRIENIGHGKGAQIHVWTQRGSRLQPDIIYRVPERSGSHAGADPLIIKNFLAFAAGEEKTTTSPIAAREAVAAGVLAHESMRTDGNCRVIPPLPDEIFTYFSSGNYPQI